MSDTSINQIIQYGTAAARGAYVPAPPSGIKTLYIWYETDNTPATWIWDGSAWVQINASGGSGINQLTGDVTAGPGVGSQAATIGNDKVTTVKILDANVTLAKLANIATDSLIGRDTAGSGVPENITLNSSLSMTGSGALQRAALTGDATASAGSNAVTIPGLALVDDGNSGTTKTIDFLSLKVGRHELTLTGNVTLTLDNPVDGGVYVLLIHTGAGSFTVTWPASVLWPSGVAPVITTTASKTDLVTLIYDSSVTKFYGSFNQNY